eukprot:7523835-Pyramimonas_sp.AAC.1
MLTGIILGNGVGPSLAVYRRCVTRPSCGPLFALLPLGAREWTSYSARLRNYYPWSARLRELSGRLTGRAPRMRSISWRPPRDSC